MTKNHSRRLSPVIAMRLEWPNSSLKRDDFRGIEDVPGKVTHEGSD